MGFAMGINLGFSGACVMALGGGYYLTLDADGNVGTTTDKADAKWFRRQGDDPSFALARLGGRDDGDNLIGAGTTLERVNGASDWRWSLLHKDASLRDFRDTKRYLVLSDDGALTMAKEGTAAKVSFEWPWSDHSIWLTKMIDFHPEFGDLPLIQLPLAGSHDSGTYGMNFAGRTQNCTIAEQLKLGIRLFDFRVRVNDGVFYIHHGLPSDNHFARWEQGNDDPLKYWPCILLEIHKFLKANPREFVILKFQSFASEGGQDFSSDDHDHFRWLLNHYLDVLDIDQLAGLRLKDAGGKAAIFYENIGEYAGKPGEPGGNWGHIAAFKIAKNQKGLSEYIRLWDPYWDDESSSLADEGPTDKGGVPIALTDRWKLYHANNLCFWQGMVAARFFVAQAQMQVCSGDWVDMGVPVYFSKAERSAAYNNKLNAAMFVEWMGGLDWGMGVFRPNVMTMDFVENGNLTDQIVARLEAIPKGEFSAHYAPASSFLNQCYCRIAFGSGSGTFYLGEGDGWVRYTSASSDALQFRLRMEPGPRVFYLVSGGDYDGYYLSLRKSDSELGLYGDDKVESWTIKDGALLSDYSGAYAQPGGQDDWVYANVTQADAMPGCRQDWS
jgi:hypothetical protein